MKIIQAVSLRIHVPRNEGLPAHQGLFLPEAKHLVWLERDKVMGTSIDGVVEGDEPFLFILIPSITAESTAPLEAVELKSLEVSDELAERLAQVHMRVNDSPLARTIYAELQNACS